MARNDRSWKKKRENQRKALKERNEQTSSKLEGQSLDKVDRSKGVIIMSTNIGSFGKDSTENSVIVRKQLHEKLALVNNKFGPVDSLAIQECGIFDVKLLPFFAKPVSTNEAASYGKNDRGKRGVCLYSKDGLGLFDTNDDVNEICVSIRSYINSRGSKVNFAIINCYRNQSVNYERSSVQTKIAISKIIDNLKSKSIKKMVILGDFNDTNFSLPNFREILHNKLYHKANSISARRKIDKVFTNIENCGFIDILASCENVHGPIPSGGHRQKPPESDLGHKTIVLYVGAKIENKPIIEETFPSIKQLNNIIKGLDGSEMLPKPDFSVALENFKYTEWLAETLTDKCKELLERAKITVKRKATNNNVVLLRTIEQDAEDPAKKKVGNQWDSTYSFMDKFKSGIGDGNESIRPPLADNANKLNKKLNNLNVMREDITIPATEKLFPVNTSNRGGTIIDKNHFKRLILAVSNSGAPDYMKMSLKHTKAILGRNRNFRNFFHVIVERCLKSGYFPEVWKVDNISFLYKNKGDRKLPEFYRPITISPSLGKHLEKFCMNYLSTMDDKNADNNAYKTGRSCQTAIANTQKALLEMKNPLINEVEHEDLMLGGRRYKYITNINTEDIKSAFESIEHKLIFIAISRNYAGDTDYKVASLVCSYLKRNAFAAEKNCDTRVELIRRYQNKTAPQGSLLSPFLWRIYDSIFTSIYKSFLKVAVDKKTFDLFMFRHISYADDHLTVFTIRVLASADTLEIATKVRGALNLCRSMLSKATKIAGCGINPDKSENIVTENLHDAFKKVDPDFEVKNSFKWLGYILILTTDGQLIFDVASVTSRLIALANLRNDIFQYTNSVSIRMKIYKTYFAPFIELYAPVILQLGADVNSEIHKFQHRCLCHAIGISFTANRKMVEEKCCEPPVIFKAVRMAIRIQFCCDTITAEENAIKKAGVTITNRVTRAGTSQLIGGALSTQARKNIIFRINDFAKKQGIESNKDEKIDFVKLGSWVKTVNSSINKKILTRTLSTANRRGRD